MKILFITDAWEPQINGVVTALKQTIHYAEKAGHATFVIHPNLFPAVPILFYREIHLALFPHQKLKALFDKTNPDAIHIATEGPLGIASRALCRKYKLPFTTAYHTHFPLYIETRTHLPARWFFWYFRWFHNASTRTIVSTQTLADTLTSHGFHHLAVSPLGVDTKLFSCPAPPLLLPEGEMSVCGQRGWESMPRPVFVYLGRIAREKNVEDFLRADLPGTKILIGDGPDRKKLAKKYPEAQFLGYRKGKDLASTLCECDVLVMPSKTETFGLVVLEALACGVPVGAYPVMGPKDILTNSVDGYLDTDLARAAKNCLHVDRTRCRETALRYDWEKATEVFLSHLAVIQK